MYEKIHVNLDMRESGQAHYGRNFTSLSKNDKASFFILHDWNMIWYANKSTISIGNGKIYYFCEGFYVPEFDVSWLGGRTYYLLFGQ